MCINGFIFFSSNQQHRLNKWQRHQCHPLQPYIIMFGYCLINQDGIMNHSMIHRLFLNQQQVTIGALRTDSPSRVRLSKHMHLCFRLIHLIGQSIIEICNNESQWKGHCNLVNRCHVPPEN